MACIGNGIYCAIVVMLERMKETWLPDSWTWQNKVSEPVSAIVIPQVIHFHAGYTMKAAREMNDVVFSSCLQP